MKPTLCLDVDSTIWDTGAWVCAAVLEVTGEDLDVEEVTTWTHVLDTYGEETTTVVFDASSTQGGTATSSPRGATCKVSTIGGRSLISCRPGSNVVRSLYQHRFGRF